MRCDVTQVEIAALLAVAQDHAFGQPPGAQLRAAVLGQRLATAAGSDRAERAATWWTSSLRFLGCTGHAYEVAVLFGDEIELRAESLRADAANPVDIMRLMISHAGPGLSGAGRLRSVLSVIAGGRKAAEMNFRTACEVADAFAVRLGLDDSVRAALARTFERWNGRGLPAGVKGAAIPRPMRIAQVAQEFEVLARVEGTAQAIEIVKTRRGKAYDPELADVVLEEGAGWWEAVEPADPWDAALAVAPASAPLGDAAAHESLLVLADFADLKSPWTSGHSRAVAALALEACGPAAEAAAVTGHLSWQSPRNLSSSWQRVTQVGNGVGGEELLELALGVPRGPGLTPAVAHQPDPVHPGELGDLIETEGVDGVVHERERRSSAGGAKDRIRARPGALLDRHRHHPARTFVQRAPTTGQHRHRLKPVSAHLGHPPNDRVVVPCGAYPRVTTTRLADT